MRILDHGFLTLETVAASDLMVVNAARVSLNKRSDELTNDDIKLIEFLMRNRHGTPFEHNLFTFHVKCPLFIAREWMRHRIGSFNEWSGRYSQLEPDFYIPAGGDVRSQRGKPGEYTFEPTSAEVAERYAHALELNCRMAYESYESALRDGVAKELARLHLPVNIYTQFFWSVNARSLMNFLSLRLHETAMWEIRQYAIRVDSIFHAQMPHTCEAWEACGRVAP